MALFAGCAGDGGGSGGSSKKKKSSSSNSTTEPGEMEISASCESYAPNASYSCTLSATNPSSGTLTWTEDNDPCNYFSINASTGEITATIPSGPTASCNYTVTVSDGSLSDQKTLSLEKSTCPSGFVEVLGNSSLGTVDFCVMKFEARCSSDCNVATDIPVSTSTGTPWVNIAADESAGAGSGAQARCEAMTESGFNGTFTLISNPEWMTIARDIESVDANWSNGTVGDGALNRGHSDNNPGNALGISDEDDPWTDTGQTSSDWSQKRTHILTNGSIVWDMSGNVYNYVDWDGSDVGYTLGPTDAAATLRSVQVLDGSLTSDDLQPVGAGFDHIEGMGRWYGGSGGGTKRGVNWQHGGSCGVYSMRLEEAPSTADTTIGFRCVYRY